MPAIAPLKVQVVAQTQFTPPADVPWATDADGGQALAEFAGRACYQSLDEAEPGAPPPTPATCGTSSRSGHLSVLEHGIGVLLLHRRLPLAAPTS